MQKSSVLYVIPTLNNIPPRILDISVVVSAWRQPRCSSTVRLLCTSAPLHQSFWASRLLQRSATESAVREERPFHIMALLRCERLLDANQHRRQSDLRRTLSIGDIVQPAVERSQGLILLEIDQQQQWDLFQPHRTIKHWST